jgi:predicted nucleotidyltransferase
MQPFQALQAHRAASRHVIAARRGGNARVSGSVAHGCDPDHSDPDILIDPAPGTTLFNIGAVRHDLRTWLGVPADVLTPNALPDQFRDAVLAKAMSV